MDVVDVESTMAVDLHIARVLRELSIQLSLMFSPVKATLPPLRKALDIRQWRTILPARVWQLIRECGQVQFLLQEVQRSLRDRYLERGLDGSFGHGEWQGRGIWRERVKNVQSLYSRGVWAKLTPLSPFVCLFSVEPVWKGASLWNVPSSEFRSLLASRHVVTG